MSYSPEHYQQNKEVYSAKSKAWREQNKERARETRSRHYFENKEKYQQYCWERNLAKKYKLTKQQYEEILQEQGGVCAICGGTCKRRLAVDHDHDTGKVRGLLCSRCNRALGYFQDSTEILQNALKYITGKGGSCGV
jgi:hypothetical protein